LIVAWCHTTLALVFSMETSGLERCGKHTLAAWISSMDRHQHFHTDDRRHYFSYGAA
jgi:hypothetical protein